MRVTLLPQYDILNTVVFLHFHLAAILKVIHGFMTRVSVVCDILRVRVGVLVVMVFWVVMRVCDAMGVSTDELLEREDQEVTG